MTAIAERALIDPGRLDELRSVLGAAQIRQLLLAFVDELDSRPARIAEHVARGDHAAARHAAHLFKGAALSIGAGRTAWLANAVEQASEHDMTAKATALLSAASDTLTVLRDHPAVCP